MQRLNPVISVVNFSIPTQEDCYELNHCGAVMTHNRHPKRGSDRPGIYQIILQGHLSRRWSDWFEGFTITLDEQGQTLLTGPVIDQAALHGLLKKIRDLGLPLISVNRLDPDEEMTSQ